MIIIMKPTATQADVQTICDWITSLRYQPRVTTGSDQTIIACIGSEINPQTVEQLEALPTVQEIIHVSKKYKLVSRDFKHEDTIVDIKGTKIGGGNIPVLAGPCAVESYDQFHAVVADLVALGITVIRAMVYKPRTSTYDFQGLKEEGIRVLREVKHDFPQIAYITEVPGPNQLEALMDVTDVFQVGARNSQNYDLLERLGKAGKPVILKRGIAGTVEEWLQSAEYLMANGCKDVILCERGIRTYETITRNCLDRDHHPQLPGPGRAGRHQASDPPAHRGRPLARRRQVGARGASVPRRPRRRLRRPLGRDPSRPEARLLRRRPADPLRPVRRVSPGHQALA